MGWWVFGGVGLALVIAALLLLARAMRRRRLYVWFRVVDRTSGAPLVGAKVFGLSTFAHAHVVHDRVEVQSSAKRKLLGVLDASGAFRRVLGHRQVGALELEAPGLVAAIVGVELVAEHLAFPSEPFACSVEKGRLLPPVRRSAVSLGLMPGQKPEQRVGYANLYEKPELHSVVQCHASLEEARRRGHGAGLDRFWRIEGELVTEHDGGFQLAARRVEPVGD